MTGPQFAEPWLRFQCDERVGAHVARHRLSLSSPWTCLFGASGSGKTTLLRLLAGLLPQRTGECLVWGRDLRARPPHLRQIVLVDAAGSLFPHRDVQQNIAFAVPGSQAVRQSESRCMLELFGLAAFAHARVQQLSGGQTQRVAMARALCARPRVLLLDESFSALDREHREQVRHILLGVQAARAAEGRPMAIVSVTHDVSEVFATGGEVLRIHDGSIVAQGPAAVVLAPERASLLRLLSEPAPR